MILMLGNEGCKINTRTFQNDMTTFRGKDDVLTLLVHLGYLAYEERQREVRIPNLEIGIEFANAIEGAGWENVIKALMDSEELLAATIQQDAETVAKYIEKVHMENTSILNDNNENALSCVISLAYYSAGNDYHIIREMPAGKGFADIVFVPIKRSPERPALLVELKWDLSAYTAIQQIKEKEYGKTLENYAGKGMPVGISYDKESKKHQGEIECCEIGKGLF